MYTMLYSILIWSTVYKYGAQLAIPILTLQVLQKRVVRLMLYDDQFPLIPGPLPASSPLFVKLGLLKFYFRSLYVYI